MPELQRCAWAGADPRLIAYHDQEWGVPVHDDGRFFEFLILEGAQAGLSWSTILNKRENYRAAFADFDPGRVARFTDARLAKLLADPGIVRNRAKIESAVRMFGCDAFFAGEKIFAVIWTDGRLALKLTEPALHAELLGQPGAEPWRPYGSGMGNWVLAPEALAADTAALRLWLERAHAPALAENGHRRRPRRKA
mgnify:CR=1 FL=1